MPRRLSPALIIVLAGLLVYLPVVGQPFFFLDDESNIFANPNLLSFSWTSLVQIWREPYLGFYIPLTYSLWGMQAKVAALLPAVGNGQLNPAFFHLVNLLTHLGNSWLVFAILKELRLKDTGALLGALLFALHPLQVEAVAWASGFKDLGSGGLALLALRQYLRLRPQFSAGRQLFCSPGYWLLLGYFVLALLAKPGSVVVPLLCLLVGYLEFDRRPLQLLRELWPLFGLALLAVVGTWLVQPVRSEFFLPNLWQRVIVAGDALAFYGYKLLFPWTVVFDYGRSPQAVLAQGSTYLFSGLAYLTGAAIWYKGGKPGRLAVGIFFLALLPVLGFLPFHFQNVSTVADRYLYLALLGPGWALGWLFAQTRSRWGRWLWLLPILLLAGRSVVQVGSWRDSFTVCDQTLAANPKSWLAYSGRGQGWAAADRDEEAIGDYHQALRFYPPQDKVGQATTYGNLGNAYSARQRYGEARQAFLQALALNPNDVSAHFNLGLIANSLNEPEQAAAYFAKTIELNPNFEPAYMTLADMYRKLGRPAEGQAVYRRVLASGSPPRRAEAALRLGELAQEARDFNQAEGYYRQALGLWPDYPEPYGKLADLLVAGGRGREAVPLLLEGVRLDPGWAAAYNQLSILALRQGQYGPAVEYGERALALGLNDPIQQRALDPYRRGK